MTLKIRHSMDQLQVASGVVVVPSDEWATPADLFAELSTRYGRFTLDAAAAQWNHKCDSFFTATDNGLTKPWAGRVWLNPPYSRGNLEAWLSKARREVLDGRAESVCCLVPASTGEGWWVRNVAAGEGVLRSVWQQSDELGVAVRCRYRELQIETLYLAGRVRFCGQDGKGASCARFSSAVVVFSRSPKPRPPSVAGRPVGRPTKFRPEAVAQVRAELGAGGILKAALANAGISRRSWYRYVGREAHQ